ncbi:MAG: RusA family crossover junction endodeoxyribonuclease [Bradymonadales bacterium]
MITFTVPGQPQGKGRPRFAKVGGYVKAYTPEQTASYESFIKLAYYKAGGGMSEKPVKLTVRAFYLVPDSWSKKKRIAALGGGVRPTVKPDIDNIVKVVCDALNELAYSDDKQIVALECYKHYDVAPRVEIEIKEVV